MADAHLQIAYRLWAFESYIDRNFEESRLDYRLVVSRAPRGDPQNKLNCSFEFPREAWDEVPALQARERTRI
jgi:hypothetical protein